MGNSCRMTTNHGSQTEALDEELPHEAIVTRASGRPPEEASSDDPERQAEAILEESEDRTTDVAKETSP
jgi:hypothetical protein